MGVLKALGVADAPYRSQYAGREAPQKQLANSDDDVRRLRREVAKRRLERAAKRSEKPRAPEEKTQKTSSKRP